MTERRRAVRQRGITRRDALLDAAIEVVAERGIGGVTHRAVAERAGVPVSSTTYFFDSIDDLIADAVLTMMERELQRLAEFQQEAVRNALPERHVIDEFVEFVAGSSTLHMTAQFEAYLFASRHPRLQPKVATILEATRDVAAGILASRGLVDPAAKAAFAALIDGFALHRIAYSEVDSLIFLNRGLRALAIGFAALAVSEDAPSAG